MPAATSAYCYLIPRKLIAEFDINISPKLFWVSCREGDLKYHMPSNSSVPPAHYCVGFKYSEGETPELIVEFMLTSRNEVESNLCRSRRKPYRKPSDKFHREK